MSYAKITSQREKSKKSGQVTDIFRKIRIIVISFYETSIKHALAPAQATDMNTVDNPDVIQLQTRTEKLNTNLSVPPHSIILYEYHIN